MQRQTSVRQIFFHPVDTVNPVQKEKKNRQDEQDEQRVDIPFSLSVGRSDAFDCGRT